MKVLVTAGAGTSIELGVPGMTGLAQEFVEHCDQWDIEPALVTKLLGGTLDIEYLIEELDQICSATSSLEAIGEVDIPLYRFDKVRAEIEWFIQHAAERVLPRDAHLMWSGVLRATGGRKLTIVTTNYDRAIEMAANAEKLGIDDGFGEFNQHETAPWIGFKDDANALALVKLHGSTDWYAEAKAGSPTKLRHPMPLFGRATLQLPAGTELGSALILPSREKLLTRNPYPRLSQAFLNACDTCDIGIFVGSSLRDHHLRGAGQALAARVPTFIVGPAGSDLEITNATPIAQTASRFLIGVLPGALRSHDPELVLRQASALAPNTMEDTLGALRSAVDVNLSTLVRCRALEEMDEQGAVLDADWLRPIIEYPDAQVARYAFGLIPQSPDCDDLVVLAHRSAHKQSDPAYAEDLELLTHLIASSR